MHCCVLFIRNCQVLSLLRVVYNDDEIIFLFLTTFCPFERRVALATTGTLSYPSPSLVAFPVFPSSDFAYAHSILSLTFLLPATPSTLVSHTCLGFLLLSTLIVCWDSSVGTATRYGLDGPEIASRWGARFSHLSRVAPGHT